MELLKNPTIIYFAIFAWANFNIKHNWSKMPDQSASSVAMTPLVLLMGAVLYGYVIYFAWQTEWWLFIPLIVVALLGPMVIETVLNTLTRAVISATSVDIRGFYRNTALSLIIALVCGLLMIQGVSAT